jgi:hypothetical protein
VSPARARTIRQQPGATSIDDASARWHDADELRWTARHWAARIGVKPTRIQLRPMRAKWGSISTAGRLSLDTGLLDVPKPLGEFVIVHELVHLLAPNHGRVFKSFMHAYMPDWQQRERATYATTAGSLLAARKHVSAADRNRPHLRGAVTMALAARPCYREGERGFSRVAFRDP